MSGLVPDWRKVHRVGAGLAHFLNIFLRVGVGIVCLVSGWRWIGVGLVAGGRRTGVGCVEIGFDFASGWWVSPQDWCQLGVDLVIGRYE